MSSYNFIRDSSRSAVFGPETNANQTQVSSGERGAPAELSPVQVPPHRDEPDESDKWLTIERFASDSGQAGTAAMRANTKARAGGKTPTGITAPATQAQDPAKGAWPLTLDEIIKQTLVRLLRETGGNRRRTASLLGISRSTLYRMLARYGIDRVGRSALSPRSRIGGPPMPPT
jgi:Bacterial regulatory protein, Fis family